MRPSRRAVIDIGTNSVKVLVAEVLGETVTAVWEESEQTRLGRGFYETHELQASAIEHTASVASQFAHRAKQFNAQDIRLIATSAARDAVNKDQLLTVIRQACGLPVQVISGEQEAEWVFQGVSTDPRFHGRKLMILDVGGGSTEIIVGEKGHYSFRQSFPLGSVRLLEKLAPANLAMCQQWLREFFVREIASAIESRLHAADCREIQLVGTGGTTSILARMERRMRSFDRESIEQVSLSRERIDYWLHQLWSVSLAERKQIIGLPPNRADIIPFGVAIYEAVMEHFGFPKLFVSTRGLRFGAVLAPANEQAQV
jgi:exopolyphosphatase / guanosine-5'-triphosphate,3'-diphosphate pyrophosphatase